MKERWYGFREYLRRLTPAGWLAFLLLAVSIVVLFIGISTRPFNQLLVDIPYILDGCALLLLGLMYSIRSNLRLPVWTQTHTRPHTSTWFGYGLLLVGPFLVLLGIHSLIFSDYSYAFQDAITSYGVGVVIGAGILLMADAYLPHFVNRWNRWRQQRALAQNDRSASRGQFNRGNAANDAASATPTEAPPARVSRRTLFVGGASALVALTGIGWLIADLPALLPLRTVYAASELFPPVFPAWAPDGRRLVYDAGKGSAQVYDATTGANLQCIDTGADAINGLAWSPDGARLAVGVMTNQLDTGVQLWEVQAQKLLLTHPNGNTDTTYGANLVTDVVLWQPHGEGLIISANNAIIIWDATTGKQRMKITSANAGTELLAWSPDGRYLAGLSENQVVIWDVTSGKRAALYSPDPNAAEEVRGFTTLAWSPNGQRIAVGYDHNQTIILDALTGANRQIAQGTLDSMNQFPNILTVNAISWSPDSRYFAVASEDTTVRIWRDNPNGQPEPVFVWRGNLSSAGVKGVAWSPAGNLIASTGFEGMIQVWRPQGDLWG